MRNTRTAPNCDCPSPESPAHGIQPITYCCGFTISARDGSALPGNYVYRAYRDPADPTAIRLRINLPLQPGDLVGYGQGLQPYCNVVDDADMGLCAFLLPLQS